MITRKTLYFDKFDDKFFTEVAKEINNGFTVEQFVTNPSICCGEVNREYIKIELINFREGIGF